VLKDGDMSRLAKRALVARLLNASPSASNRTIALQADVSHPWVAKIRRELEAVGMMETITVVEDTGCRPEPRLDRSAVETGAEEVGEVGVDFLAFLSLAESRGWPNIDHASSDRIDAGVENWLAFTASAEAGKLRDVWSALRTLPAVTT
jgi:hypothetical protein